MMENQKMNELEARQRGTNTLDAGNQSAFRLQNEITEQKRIEALTPEEKKQAKEVAEDLSASIQAGDVLGINEIIRQPYKKRLLSPGLLQKAFETLRSAHMDTVKANINTGNIAVVTDEVAGRLQEVGAGYHEIFQRVGEEMNQKETTESDKITLAGLQSEVTEAENMIAGLLRNINSVSAQKRMSETTSTAIV